MRRWPFMLKARAFRRDRCGATAVEFALVVPAFVAILFASVAFGHYLWVRSALQYAVTTAARCAALNSSKCANVAAYAQSQVAGFSVPANAFTVSATASCGISGYAKGSSVSVSYSYRSPVTLLFMRIAPVTLTASACWT